MLVHRISAPLKGMLPGFLWRPLRGVMTALLTPVYFSWRTGHFKSAVRARAVDRRGRPIPWYTYSCVDFMRDKDFTARDVLEFGSGQSTLWWADRARSVVSLEADEAWYRRVAARVPPNVAVHHVPRDLAGAQAILDASRFDLIVVDGLDRVEACRIAPGYLASGGAILLDNADGYPQVMGRMRDAGFARIDFYGHAAGVILPHCTSLFFREACFLLDGATAPARNPSR